MRVGVRVAKANARITYYYLSIVVIKSKINIAFRNRFNLHYLLFLDSNRKYFQDKKPRI